MKKNLLLAASLLFGAMAIAQEVTIPMQPAYANQVYYKFSTNTQTAAAATSWDLAFEKAPGTMALGAIRINDGRGIQAFQAAGATTSWATIDIANEASWTPLYNSETEWSVGAFDNGTATYGWGEYNLNGDHHVNGTIVFVLKYSSTSYKKVIVEDYNPYTNAITVKYANWDATNAVWGEDQTYVVDNAALAEGYSWNYLSLDTNAIVAVAPADADWDLVFRKYYGNIGTDESPMMYSVTGVFQNANVTVAQIDEAGTVEAPTTPTEENYSEEINTIGDDWKTYTGGAYVLGDHTYYVKYANGAIYRMYFTSFVGSSTGDVVFNSQNIATAGLDDVHANASFGVYPNPSTDKNVTLAYDLKNNSTDKNTVSIYNLSGAKVFETEITNNAGFYTKELTLSNLSAGVYIVKLQAGNTTATQKLILQ